MVELLSLVLAVIMTLVTCVSSARSLCVQVESLIRQVAFCWTAFLTFSVLVFHLSSGDAW